jgi:hyperosmotically inducible protein
MRTRALALALAGTLGWVTAYAADTAPPRGGAELPAESKAPSDYIEDSVLTVRVKTALLAERSIPAVDISVETNKSEVQLSGKVENDQQRRTAVQVASAVQGVAGVKDRLAVRSPR